jgi:alanine racemase
MQAATVVINRRALRHNLQRLRELAPASKLVAVVKANAYGHGLLETARTLPMPTPLASPVLKKPCACARAASPSRSCCWRVFEAADLPVISAQRLHTAVHSPEQLAALEQADLPSR